MKVLDKLKDKFIFLHIIKLLLTKLNLKDLKIVCLLQLYIVYFQLGAYSVATMTGMTS